MGIWDAHALRVIDCFSSSFYKCSNYGINIIRGMQMYVNYRFKEWGRDQLGLDDGFSGGVSRPVRASAGNRWPIFFLSFSLRTYYPLLWFTLNLNLRPQSNNGSDGCVLSEPCCRTHGTRRLCLQALKTTPRVERMIEDNWPQARRLDDRSHILLDARSLSCIDIAIGRR